MYYAFDCALWAAMKSAIVKFFDDPVFHLGCHGSLIRIKRLVLVVGIWST